MKRGFTHLLFAVLISLVSGCAKVTLINQNKATRAINSQGAWSSQAVVPGFAIVSGGGFATGEGISVRSTVGEVTGEALQSGGTINLWSGIQSSISN